MHGLNWIAVDWGTTNLRAWAMAGDGRVLARAQSADGMGALHSEAFEAALIALIGDWLGAARQVPVVACGMVGSRQGWIEAPYAAVPCAPLHSDRVVRPAVRDSRLVVYVVPGLKQDAPADVMRGEETQIAGFLTGKPDFDGVLCLPGTHTKWAHISAGEVVSFQTFMTGELFGLLAQHSVLRHGMAGDGWDDAAFAEGVDRAMSRPERIAAQLFSLRAEGVLHGLTPAAARARLSGLLIGAELAAARPYWLGQEVAVIGADGMANAYAAALAAQGLVVTQSEVEAMTLAGLASVRARLKGVGA